MRSLRLWVLLGAALCACSSGGSDDSSDSNGASDAEPARADAERAYCAGYCKGLAFCGVADLDACTLDCSSNANLVGVRSDALVQLGACYETQDCSILEGERPWEACYVSVAAALPLRTQVLNYCESSSAAYFRCDIWQSVEECTYTVGFWTDEVLSSAAGTCNAARCADLQDCVTTYFDQYR